MNKVYKMTSNILFEISILFNKLSWFFHDQGIYLMRRIKDNE